VDCIQLAQSWSPIVGFCEYDYEPLGSIKAGHLLKFIVFWAVMLCSLVDRYQCFRATCYLHLCLLLSAGRHYHIPENHELHIQCHENLKSQGILWLTTWEQSTEDSDNGVSW